MTGANILEDICGPLSYVTTNTTHSTRVLRWANQAQLDMAQYDFPELITRNASFTTDGDESYDLTGESYLGSTFLRVVDESVRIDDRHIYGKPKSFIDTFDPARDYGTEAWYYVMGGRTDFRLWPAEASGSTVYLDWVKYPSTIASATAEADISFDKDWHPLIVMGALKYGYHYLGEADYALQYEQIFENKIRQAFQSSTRVRSIAQNITPIEY